MRKSAKVHAHTAAICLGLLVLTAAPASADGTISGMGTVNAINAAEHKINITHGPIPKLKWPGMTMDFTLSEAVSVKNIKVGTNVHFELHKKADGSFVIESLKPAKKSAKKSPDGTAHSHGH